MKKRMPYTFAEMCRLCKIDKAGEEKFQRLLDKNKCIGCGICTKQCPEGAVTLSGNLAHVDYTKCVGCGLCAEKCPTHAVGWTT